MRVLHTLNTLGMGGAETRLLSLVEGSSSVCEHHVAYLGGSNTLECSLRAAGASIYCLGLSTSWGLAVGATRLATIMRNHSFDLVDTHSIHAALVARSAAAVAGARICMTRHHAFHPKQGSLWYRLERASRGRVRSAIAISEAVRDELIHSGFRGRITVVPTGVDIDQYRPLANEAPAWQEPYLLMVGQFRDDQKGHDILLAALSMLRTRGLEPVTLLVGDGPVRPAVERLAADLCLRRVHFLGERLDVGNLMSHCQVLVAPSRWEGFGRVIVEGMASGACVVASRTEAIPEIIVDGVDGVLVPPEDPQSLANALDELLSHPDRRASLTVQARRSVTDKFSLRRMCQLTLDVYRSIAQS